MFRRYSCLLTGSLVALRDASLKTWAINVKKLLYTYMGGECKRELRKSLVGSTRAVYIPILCTTKQRSRSNIFPSGSLES